MLGKLKTKAAELRREIFALHLATRDPRTPRHAKVLIVCVVAYALSPIDLIPDPIPVLGYLDDLLLLLLPPPQPAAATASAPVSSPKAAHAR